VDISARGVGGNLEAIAVFSVVGDGAGGGGVDKIEALFHDFSSVI